MTSHVLFDVVLGAKPAEPHRGCLVCRLYRMPKRTSPHNTGNSSSSSMCKYPVHSPEIRRAAWRWLPSRNGAATNSRRHQQARDFSSRASDGFPELLAKGGCLGGRPIKCIRPPLRRAIGESIPVHTALANSPRSVASPCSCPPFSVLLDTSCGREICTLGALTLGGRGVYGQSRITLGVAGLLDTAR